MAGFARVAASDEFDPNMSGAEHSGGVDTGSLAPAEPSVNNEPAKEDEPEVDLKGTVEKILHRSKDDRFAVLRVKVKNGRGFKMHIVAGAVRKGLVYSTGDDIEASGVWGEHSKYGEQFKASKIKILTQENRSLAGVRRFYQKYRDRLPGIGGKTINNLISHFGNDLPEIMSDEAELAKVIPSAKAHAIAKLWTIVMNDQAEADTIKLMELGVNSRAASAIVEEWGKSAVARFSKSPWKAMQINGVGFGSAEAAARTLDLPTDHEDRIEALLDLALQETEETDGHIALPVMDLAKRAVKIAKLADAKGTQDLQVTIINQIPELIRSKKLKARMTEEGALLMRPITYAAMVSIIRSLKLAQLHPVDTPHAILEERFRQAVNAVRDQGINLNTLQQKITWNSLTQRLSIGIGFAGSGKTTSMSCVFKAFEGTKYVVTSLAGKAVVRARDTAGVDGYTMHSILKWVPERWWVPRLRMHLSASEYDSALEDGTIPGVDFDDPEMIPVNRGPGFLHDQYRRLDYHFIALDESSMPSVVLMAQFLRAVDFSKTQVVLAGDTAQLLIGPGKTFADLIDANVLPITILDEVYRQKADSSSTGQIQEPSVLPDALLNIRNGDFPAVGEGHDFIESDDKGILPIVVEEARRWNGEGRWNGSTLVMAPMRPGKCGLSAMNKALKAEFNPPAGQIQPNDIESWRLFYPTRDGQELEITKGDPVIQVTNEPLPIITSPLASNGALPAHISVRSPSKSKDERTMNGTIGLFLGFRHVPEDPTGQSPVEGWVATFKFEQENELVAVPVAMDENRFGMFRINSLEMGFAMSPYKAQGSEAKYAICVYPDEAKRTMNRNMLYTAASRGKKWTVNISKRENFDRALKIVESENRISPLCDFIRANVEATAEKEMPMIEYQMDAAKDALLMQNIGIEKGVTFDSNNDVSISNLTKLTTDLVDLNERSLMTVEEWIKTAELRKIELSREVMHRARAFGLHLDTNDEKIHEYSERLRTHDWTYEYSDDASVYRRGASNLEQINRLKHAIGPDAAYLGWVMHAPHNEITSYPAENIPTWAYTDYNEPGLTTDSDLANDQTSDPSPDGWDPTVEAPRLSAGHQGSRIDDCDIPF